MTSIFKRKGRKGYTLKFRDPKTHRLRMRQFKTKGAAERHEDRVRSAANLAEGLEVDVLFEHHAERWLHATATAVRHGTMPGYEWAIRRHLLPAFGQRYLRDITPKMIRDLLVDLRRTLGRGSVGNVRTVLHACLQSAVEDRILLANPATFRSRSRLLKLEAPAKRSGGVKAMTADQLAAFLAAADKVAGRHALLFRTMALTGLRPGEAMALKAEDVDRSTGRIKLERARTPQGRIEPCKTDRAGAFHYVDVPDALAATLAASEGWIFEGCTHDSTIRAFWKTLDAAKLPDHFTPHCLRHTYATLHLVAGESIYYVSRQLRHSDISLTVTRYGSWLPAGNRDAANRLHALVTDVTQKSPLRD